MFYQTEIENLYRISASTNRFGWWGQMSECDGWMELGGGPCGRVVNIVFINLIRQKPITTLTYITYVIFSLTELDIYLRFLSPVRTWDPLHPKSWQLGSSLALALRGSLGCWGLQGDDNEWCAAGHSDTRLGVSQDLGKRTNTERSDKTKCCPSLSLRTLQRPKHHRQCWSPGHFKSSSERGQVETKRLCRLR